MPSREIRGESGGGLKEQIVHDRVTRTPARPVSLYGRFAVGILAAYLHHADRC